MTNAISYLAIAGAILATAGAITFYWRNRSLRKNGLVAIGAIAGWKRSDNHYYPEIAFITEDGQSMRFVSSTGRTGVPVQGQTVSVLYLADKPTRAELADEVRSFFGETLCVIVAILFSLAAVDQWH